MMIEFNTYRELEAEFNRCQMAGKPCNDIVRAMTAVLRRPLAIVSIDVGEPLLRITSEAA